ncbi:MAG: ATP-binding protein [Salinivirgaceae bacterium]|nr:ATP-binding protein [Salinivirgaceae bacterium]
MVFKRKLYDTMLRWKNEKKGETALLIEGARRVGKSTLVEEFAKREYKTYILIDFSKTDRELESYFENTTNLDYLFVRLQNRFGVQLHTRESAIVFDEVQNCPLARQAIKHLVKDGRYDYIETGSLISIKKNIKNIVIPSEEHSETLYPMDLEEFYWAIGNETTPKQLRETYAMRMPMGNAVHRRWMRDIRLYMLVGGMPQAVNAYIESNDMQAVDEVKRGIIELYHNDFRRIDATGRASRLFTAIPSQLNSNASRYQVGGVIENQTSARIAEIVAEMEDSKTITMAYHVTDPNVGMGMFKDYSRYKMFLADTGLFVTLAFWDKKYTENLIYNKLLSDKLEANLGYVYENLVAQMLLAAGNKLFYYTFPTGNGNKNYEIDFLLSRGNKLVPIEVKSSGYKTHKSLDVFCGKFSSRIGERILLYTKDYQRDVDVTCLPVYFTPFM